MPDCHRASCFGEFFQAGYRDAQLDLHQLMDRRIGLRARDQSESNGGGKPTAVSMYGVNLPNFKDGDVEGVRFAYFDKRWNRQREEIVILYARSGRQFLYEFSFSSTPERMPQDRKVFDAILRSFRIAPC
jgi:hypothetical protein